MAVYAGNAEEGQTPGLWSVLKSHRKRASGIFRKIRALVCGQGEEQEGSKWERLGPLRARRGSPGAAGSVPGLVGLPQSQPV